MSDFVPELPAPETPDTYFLVQEVSDPEPSNPTVTSPTLLQTFVVNTLGSLVVAVVAPITATVIATKVKERRAARAARKAAKSEPAVEELPPPQA